MIFIFDLDGTVIDTAHRYRNGPDGSIDMAYWFANCTPEKIAADKLLPLADVMRRYFNEGHTVVICTARCFRQADHDFLANNDIPFHALLSRQGRFVTEDSPEYSTSYHGFIGDERGDAEMKSAMLDIWAKENYLDVNWRKDACMFDDNVKVIARMMKDRLMCFDAVKYNERLAA
jgi:phosphoglycolate phosphatase-like HAD superfamily hydrolase